MERGVTVRVLLDHWASSHCAGYKETLERLTSFGVEWQLMLPVQPLKGSTSGSTCATTASCWSSTAGWPSWAPRT